MSLEATSVFGSYHPIQAMPLDTSKVTRIVLDYDNATATFTLGSDTKVVEFRTFGSDLVSVSFVGVDGDLWLQDEKSTYAVNEAYRDIVLTSVNPTSVTTFQIVEG